LLQWSLIITAETAVDTYEDVVHIGVKLRAAVQLPADPKPKWAVIEANYESLYERARKADGIEGIDWESLPCSEKIGRSNALRRSIALQTRSSCFTRSEKIGEALESVVLDGERLRHRKIRKDRRFLLPNPSSTA